MTALPRTRLTSNHYGAAALIACMVFAALELAAPWMAGPERAEMNTPSGRLAYRVASLLTRAPSLRHAGSDRQELAFQLFMAGQLVLLAAFIGLLWWRIHPGLARSARLNNGLAGAQFMIVLALGSLAFHLAMAAELAALLPWRRALAWLAVLFVLCAGIDAWLLLNSRLATGDAGIRAMFLMLTFERSLMLIAAALAWLVRQERQSRAELAAANAHLRATQSLLADTVRSSERLRIARDLHDAVGHHLTALKLHLDLASRQSASQSAGQHPGQPVAALVTASELAHSLLAQVRGAVSAQRQEAEVHVRQSLELLCAGIPFPAIRLDVERGVEACSPAAARTLLACVQEAITNTVRHANATHMTVAIRREGGSIVAHIADNGHGAGAAPEGNGLCGMRERLAEQGGILAVNRATASARPPATTRRGYVLEFSLPLAGGRA